MYTDLAFVVHGCYIYSEVGGEDRHELRYGMTQLADLTRCRLQLGGPVPGR